MAKALILSDVKPDISIKELARDCDLVINLGDMFEDWLADLKEIDLPKIGVHGNHDFDLAYNPTKTDFFPRLGMTDLHLNPTSLFGLTFVGFDGAMGYVYAENNKPYKDIDTPTLQAELRKLDGISKCDIFVTHTPSLDTLDLPHILGHKGLKAFKSFIERTKPRYHLHGHMHKAGEAMIGIGKTQVYSVYPYLKLDL